jgi:DNA polymerase III subunit delta'
MNDQFNWPIIGHDKIKKFLQSGIVNDSLAHAYFFYGVDGIGKEQVAKTFAKSLICQEFRAKPVPCNICKSCEQFDKGLYADLYYVEREENEKTGKKKKNISVSQIRELQKKLNKRSFHNSYKVVIINEAEYLNKEACNCLLKTLEEPNAKTILILISNNKSSILPTILSRCQIFKFSPIISTDIYNDLVQKGIDRTSANEISRLSLGRVGKAFEYANENEKFEELKDFNRQVLELIKENAVTRFKIIEKLAKKNADTEKIKNLLNYLITVFRDLYFMKSYNNHLICNIYLENDLKLLTDRFSFLQITAIVKEAEKTKTLIARNINPQLALENLVLMI